MTSDRVTLPVIARWRATLATLRAEVAHHTRLVEADRVGDAGPGDECLSHALPPLYAAARDIDSLDGFLAEAAADINDARLIDAETGGINERSAAA